STSARTTPPREARERPTNPSEAPMARKRPTPVVQVANAPRAARAHKAEDRFEQVFEAAPTAFIAIDPQGVIQMVNVQTEKLFGYRREELLGQPVEMLVTLRFRANHPHHRNSFFASPQPRMMGVGRDLAGLRRDGAEFPIEIGLNPIATGDGMLALAAVVDISERKQAELAQRQLLEGIIENIQTLASASEELTSVSQQMASSAEETTSQANVVSSAA